MSRAALFVVIQFVLFAIFAALLVMFPVGGGQIVFGLIIVVAAFIILVLSILEHMRQNAGLPNVTPTPNHSAQLVESGVYRWIRHPIYSGVILGAVGVALMHGHAVPLLMSLVFLIFFSVKAHYEESMLRQVYPQYADYVTRTGRFFPGVNFI